MSEQPPESGEATNPHTGETVRIDRDDIEVILEGLKEMPHAMTQMAAAVEKLADNTNRAPTRSYTAAVVVAVALVNLVVVMGTLWIIRSDQVTNDKRAEDTSRVVSRVGDCLDLDGPDVDGTPVGNCASRLLTGLESTVDIIKLELRCESQRTLRDFVIANHAFAEEPPPITEECKDLQPSN